jgi:hypothetical protein
MESSAERHYKSVLKATRLYYNSNKEMITAKKREKYKIWKELNPSMKLRGRPKKVVAEVVEEVV